MELPLCKNGIHFLRRISLEIRNAEGLSVTGVNPEEDENGGNDQQRNGHCDDQMLEKDLAENKS
jgi:hypothetical protein